MSAAPRGETSHLYVAVATRVEARARRSAASRRLRRVDERQRAVVARRVGDRVEVGDAAVGGLHGAERRRARSSPSIASASRSSGDEHARRRSRGEEREQHAGEVALGAEHARAGLERAGDEAGERRDLAADRDAVGVDVQQARVARARRVDVRVVRRRRRVAGRPALEIGADGLDHRAGGRPKDAVSR